jgi:class 3 adenylate cyclase
MTLARHLRSTLQTVRNRRRAERESASCENGSAKILGEYSSAMPATDHEPHALPDDPELAQAAVAMRDTGHWGFLFDDQWRYLYVTDDMRRMLGGGNELAQWSVGHVVGSPEYVRDAQTWITGFDTIEQMRSQVAVTGPLMLADLPGGRDELRELLDPVFRDMVDEFVPNEQVAASIITTVPGVGGPVEISYLLARLRDTTGRFIGSSLIAKPRAAMSTIAAMTAMGDVRHFERMQIAAIPSRRPAAILFADLEGSSELARRLPTATYFDLGRRLVRVADQCVIDAGGLVGRHVGDGVVAFFLAESLASESAAAAACITATRALRSAVDSVAAKNDLPAEDVVLRFGLHWGSTLYVGNITTGGRTEVTALGDEVNETARIEACATGGRALASKSLIERLDADDAAALAIDHNHVSYTPLADLPTATDKARRDAPAIAVCEI